MINWELNMNKSELIHAVAAQSDLTKAEAKRVLDATLAAITGELAAGKEVALLGFGTFKVSERAARTGRNPQTGAELQIAASKIPSFKAGKALKDQVQ